MEIETRGAEVALTMKDPMRELRSDGFDSLSFHFGLRARLVHRY
jgi:hypothetical protein